MTETLPFDVSINAWAIDAWAGQSARSELEDRANRTGAKAGLPPQQQPMDLGTPADPTDWTSPDVGYGVLLPESPEDGLVKAAGGDAGDAVKELLLARPDTVMLRWDSALPPTHLRRYFPDGTSQEPRIGLSTFGTAKGRLPRYITIIGGPDRIPWSVQYALETRHAVGRLPLDEDGLGNYIAALLDDFKAQDVDVRAPLMWTVSHAGDITSEMRTIIATPLEAKLTDRQLPRFQSLIDGAATATGLLDALRSAKPALIVTSSHGLAEGSDDVLREGLGLPIDLSHTPVLREDLVAAIPGGAVWYSQACCSAGSFASAEGKSYFAGLLKPGAVSDILANVAALGSTVAPVALALLGRPSPIRGFFGHVEPTFDWTLRDPYTGQGLGGHIVQGMSTNLFAGQPLGYILDEYRAGVGVLHTDWQGLLDQLNAGDTTVREALTRTRVTALDRQSLVLLGDPTATLPDLASAP